MPARRSTLLRRTLTAIALCLALLTVASSNRARAAADASESACCTRACGCARTQPGASCCCSGAELADAGTHARPAAFARDEQFAKPNARVTTRVDAREPSGARARLRGYRCAPSQDAPSAAPPPPPCAAPALAHTHLRSPRSSPCAALRIERAWFEPARSPRVPPPRVPAA